MTNITKAPDGYEGHGFFATKLDDAVGLARKNSLWPLPFATSCCGIEFMATMAAHYDLSRFGSERLSFSPRQADLLMVMGTISKKWALSYVKFTSKWLNLGGFFLLALAQVAEVYLILIVCFRELTALFPLMFTYPDAHPDPSKY
jgi:hypothetical protein